MPRTIAVVVVSFVALGGACADPCIQLAERICNCEPTVATRRACLADRVTNQQGRVEIDDADRAACAASLETCSCAALDVGDLASCGFTPIASGVEAAE